MTHRRDDEEWMYSRSRTPSLIHLLRRLVMTSLAILGTGLLIGLVNHGSPAAGAAALGHESFDQDHSATPVSTEHGFGWPVHELAAIDTPTSKPAWLDRIKWWSSHADPHRKRSTNRLSHF